jgi:hypothetical protein
VRGIGSSQSRQNLGRTSGEEGENRARASEPMEVSTSETLVNFYQTTWRKSPADSHLQINIAYAREYVITRNEAAAITNKDSVISLFLVQTRVNKQYIFRGETILGSKNN